MSATDDQNALGIDFASTTQRPGARPTRFGTLSPSASHPCAPATQTNCAHALSLCLLAVRHARLPSPELCTNLQFFMFIAIDEAPESYALVNSHCCDTIRMSFVIFVCDFSGARTEKSSPVSVYLGNAKEGQFLAKCPSLALPQHSDARHHAFRSSQSCAKNSKAAPNAALLAKTLQ